MYVSYEISLGKPSITSEEPLLCQTLQRNYQKEKLQKCTIGDCFFNINIQSNHSKNARQMAQLYSETRV
jgi:hypothetical protein